MSRIRQVLTIYTSLGGAVNYSLQATIPAHMLTQCAAALPRPAWEPVLYYCTVLAMGFLLACMLVAAYYESERIFATDLVRRRSEMNHLVYDKSKIFDLKTISGLRLTNGDVVASKMSGSAYISRRLASSVGDTNGYVTAEAAARVSVAAQKSAVPPMPPSSLSLSKSFMSRLFGTLRFWQWNSTPTSESSAKEGCAAEAKSAASQPPTAASSPTPAAAVDKPSGSTSKDRKSTRLNSSHRL